MIQVNVFKDSHGRYCGIELSGHAGFGAYGQDIICASVSALTLNMANSVEAFTDDGFDGEMEEETGRFSFHFTSEISRESQILMDSLVLGLKNIRDSYGKQYIKIRFEEV